MGCNCGGGGKPNLPDGNSQGGNYLLLGSDGSKKYFNTESAARAANAASGNSGLVKKLR